MYRLCNGYHLWLRRERYASPLSDGLSCADGEVGGIRVFVVRPASFIFTTRRFTTGGILPRGWLYNVHNVSCMQTGKKTLCYAMLYSITERRVPELIPVLGSQPAGDVSH